MFAQVNEALAAVRARRGRARGSTGAAGQSG
jgi:hypothetical protein